MEIVVKPLYNRNDYDSVSDKFNMVTDNNNEIIRWREEIIRNVQVNKNWKLIQTM